VAEQRLYPWSGGRVYAQDPTHGQIDHDIQWAVDGMAPASVAQRAAIERTLQDRRNAGELILGVDPATVEAEREAGEAHVRGNRLAWSVLGVVLAVLFGGAGVLMILDYLKLALS